MPYNDNIFEVNWRRFARMFTAVELRRRRLMALLYAALTSIMELHAIFVPFRKNINYRLGINFQVCHLERFLNDTWDIDDRRIYIDNKPPLFLPIVFYQEAESNPVKFYQEDEYSGESVIFYNKQETPAVSLHFIIFVHEDVLFDITDMTTQVRNYCLASKNFLIQLYA